MPELLMLKGLPASGKTTYAKALVAQGCGRWKRVNKDDLREMLDNGIWSKQNEYLVCKLRNKIICTSLQQGFNVVVDDTNFNPDHEALFRMFAKNMNATFHVKDMETALDICIVRDSKRSKPVGEDVIRKMYLDTCGKNPRPVEG